jgi:cellulose synthase/poly-beta-1,6-N-acetylglucosamine synthase-like glycosyltransferase
VRARRITTLLGVALVAALWLGLVAYTVRTRDLVALQLLFLLYSGYGACTQLLGVAARGRRAEPVRPVRLPTVSVLIPARNEARVIQDTLRAMGALRYHDRAGRPRFEVLVLDDRSEDGTGERAARVPVPVPVRVVRVPQGTPPGKAAVLNLGTQLARGEILAVFDADARPDPEFLLRAVPYLFEPGVAGVQGRRLFYHREATWVARGQEHEFAAYQSATQRARERWGAHVLFGGNGMLINRRALEAAGGWNVQAPTEDIDLAIRFHALGWRVRYCEEAVVWEESVPTWAGLVRQRARWSEGVLRALVDHALRILRGHMTLLQKADLLLFLTGSVLIPAAVFASHAYAAATLLRGALEPYYLLPLPRSLPEPLTVGAFGLLTAALITSAAVEVRAAPWRVAAGFAAYLLFTAHQMLSTPLALLNCAYAAATGRTLWFKTEHAAPWGESDSVERDPQVGEWLALGSYRRAIP